MLAVTVSTLALFSAGSVLAKDIPVAVGRDGKLFSPQEVQADVGDTVTFGFWPEAHTVTQSSLAKPCEMLMDEETGEMGFDSGSMPVSDDVTEFPTMTLEVNSTDPVWVYCKPHCELGMVMSINAATSGDKSFSAFQANAMGGSASSGGAADASAEGEDTAAAGGSASGAEGEAAEGAGEVDASEGAEEVETSEGAAGAGAVEASEGAAGAGEVSAASEGAEAAGTGAEEETLAGASDTAEAEATGESSEAASDIAGGAAGSDETDSAAGESDDEAAAGESPAGDDPTQQGTATIATPSSALYALLGVAAVISSLA